MPRRYELHTVSSAEIRNRLPRGFRADFDVIVRGLREFWYDDSHNGRVEQYSSGIIMMMRANVLVSERDWNTVQGMRRFYDRSQVPEAGGIFSSEHVEAPNASNYDTDSSDEDFWSQKNSRVGHRHDESGTASYGRSGDHRLPRLLGARSFRCRYTLSNFTSSSDSNVKLQPTTAAEVISLPQTQTLMYQNILDQAGTRVRHPITPISQSATIVREVLITFTIETQMGIFNGVIETAMAIVSDRRPSVQQVLRGFRTLSLALSLLMIRSSWGSVEEIGHIGVEGTDKAAWLGMFQKSCVLDLTVVTVSLVANPMRLLPSLQSYVFKRCLCLFWTKANVPNPRQESLWRRCQSLVYDSSQRRPVSGEQTQGHETLTYVYLPPQGSSDTQFRLQALICRKLNPRDQNQRRRSWRF